jgi:hypothetical protein
MGYVQGEGQTQATLFRFLGRCFKCRLSGTEHGVIPSMPASSVREVVLFGNKDDGGERNLSPSASGSQYHAVSQKTNSPRSFTALSNNPSISALVTRFGASSSRKSKSGKPRFVTCPGSSLRSLFAPIAPAPQIFSNTVRCRGSRNTLGLSSLEISIRVPGLINTEHRRRNVFRSRSR